MQLSSVQSAYQSFSRLFSVFSFIYVIGSCTALEERIVDVGALCSSTADCGSNLLYCSSEGVCLCDEQRANFVYEYRHQFTIREPKCEVLPCTIAKDHDKNECNLRHARCLQHPDGNKTVGFCKCPGQQVGARRGTAFSMSHCKDVIHSTVGQKCISNHYICDVSKKLKCRDGTCECYTDHLFSFEENMCILQEEYIKKYGYHKLGTLDHYCSRSSDCNSGMFCKNKRCDCPNFCRGEVYVRRDDVCYCAFDMTRLAYIIPIIVISILFIIFAIGFCYFNRKYYESLQTQSNLVLVHGRGKKLPPCITNSNFTTTPRYLCHDSASLRSPTQHQHRHHHQQMGRLYSSMPRLHDSVTVPVTVLNDENSETGSWGPEEEEDEIPSPTQQRVSTLSLNAQQLQASNKFSYYPPPPYQLNELIAAEVVEAQMSQVAASPVPSQFRDSA